MTVIQFPQPPGGGEPPDGSDDLPRFEDHSINEEQLATLEMMGLTLADVIGEQAIALYIPAGFNAGGLPSIAGAHILDRYDPVVMHRGRRRVIRMNGDIHSLPDPE